MSYPLSGAEAREVTAALRISAAADRRTAVKLDGGRAYNAHDQSSIAAWKLRDKARTRTELAARIEASA